MRKLGACAKHAPFTVLKGQGLNAPLAGRTHSRTVRTLEAAPHESTTGDPIHDEVRNTNPAGLSALGPRVDLSGGLIAPSVEYRATGLASGQTIESDRPPTFIPTLAMVYRTDERLTLGLATLATAGLGVDYPADLYGSASTRRSGTRGSLPPPRTGSPTGSPSARRST